MCTEGTCVGMCWLLTNMTVSGRGSVRSALQHESKSKFLVLDCHPIKTTLSEWDSKPRPEQLCLVLITQVRVTFTRSSAVLPCL